MRTPRAIRDVLEAAAAADAPLHPVVEGFTDQDINDAIVWLMKRRYVLAEETKGLGDAGPGWTILTIADDCRRMLNGFADPNRDVWEALTKSGHTLGTPYVQKGAGLFVMVDGVAMSIAGARAVAQKCATVAEIAGTRNAQPGS